MLRNFGRFENDTFEFHRGLNRIGKLRRAYSSGPKRISIFLFVKTLDSRNTRDPTLQTGIDSFNFLQLARANDAVCRARFLVWNFTYTRSPFFSFAAGDNGAGKTTLLKGGHSIPNEPREILAYSSIETLIGSKRHTCLSAAIMALLWATQGDSGPSLTAMVGNYVAESKAREKRTSIVTVSVFVAIGMSRTDRTLN